MPQANVQFQEVYGVHLMLRLANVENNLPGQSEKELKKVIVDLIAGLGMRVLAGPVIGRETGDVAHEGLSGVAILYESHVAIHTYPLMKQLYVDIFSCKTFHEAEAVELLHQAFGSFTIVEKTLLNRGLHWRGDAQKALQAFMKDQE